MRRFGQLIGLDRARLDEYRRHHAAIWPEIARAIRRAGLRNYTIFHRGGRLFACYEYVGPPEEYAARLRALAAAPRMREWWDLMEPMQIPEPDRAEGEWWADMEEVFHLDGELAPDEVVPELAQSWPRPSSPLPVVSIGTGGIFRNAHAPAYARTGFAIRGVYDADPAASRSAARDFGIGEVYATLDEAASVEGAVFDLATPGSQVVGILERLPRGAAVLIQKPMGQDLAEARRILRVCRERELLAAVNFQLRFSPAMLAVRDALRRGLLGEVTELEVRVNVHTPWELWPFLRGIPRMEVLYHSIHYLDVIRSFLGDPRGVWSHGVRHPRLAELAETRSTTILDYAGIRCSVSTNHSHRFGPRHAASELRIEGLAGAAVAKLGVNLDYPRGEPDELELCLSPGADPEWIGVALEGSWFVEAFPGPMSNLQRFAAGEDAALVSGVEDAVRTMALVEACYASSEGGATPLPAVD